MFLNWVKQTTYLGSIITCLVFWLPASSVATPQKPRSFHARQMAIYAEQPLTFFSAQMFDQQGKISLKPNKKCPTTTVSVRWIPIVPLATCLQNEICYQQKICVNERGVRYKGLACCQERLAHYAKLKHDHYNYIPEITLYASRIKTCLASPEPEYRGFIARTYLYLYDTYFVALSLETRQQYLRWHHEYPPEEWELKRHHQIAQYQTKNLYYRD